MKRLMFLLLWFFVAGAASAGPMRYMLTGISDATLGGVGYTAASIDVTAIGDSDDVFEVDQGIWLSPLQQFSVVLAGQAPVFALEQVFFFVNQNNGTAGFLDQFAGDFLDVGAPTLAAYNGAHAFGPVPVSATLLAPFSTTGGVLELTALDSAQFVALEAVVPLPLPGSASLLLAGLAAWAMLQKPRCRV